MTRIEALGQLTLLLISGLSYLGGFLLMISGFWFMFTFGWVLLAIDPTSPFDDGQFAKAAWRLLGATIGAGLGILLIWYGKYEFQRVSAKVKKHGR